MAAPPDHRFSRDETALILRRATEGERRPRSEVEGGLTLDEIVAAAQDAGIDAAAVRRAAALIDVAPDRIRSLFVGAPVAPVIRARFRGRLPATIDAIRACIEDAVGRRGEIKAEAGGFVWSEDHGLGRTYVRARADSDVVEVSAEAERKGHLLALVMGMATAVALALQPLGGFAGLAGVVGAALSVLAPVALIGLGTRLIWPAFQRPVIARLEAAVLEVGALLDEAPEGGS